MPSYVIDVPVTLSVTVRGTSEEDALNIAQEFACELSPSKQFVEGYSSNLPKGVAITSACLESPSDESPEVLDEEDDEDEEESKVKMNGVGDRDENIAAISAEIHRDLAKWDEFYALHGFNLGGFPGIWRYAITAADAFTEEEKTVAEGKFEYLDAIETFAQAILRAEVLPSDAELREMAQQAIKVATC